jgi:hypothetical protein
MRRKVAEPLVCARAVYRPGTGTRVLESFSALTAGVLALGKLGCVSGPANIVVVLESLNGSLIPLLTGRGVWLRQKSRLCVWKNPSRSPVPGVSVSFDGRGCRSSAIGHRVSGRPSALTAGGRFCKSGYVCLVGHVTATSTRVLESLSALTGGGGPPQTDFACLVYLAVVLESLNWSPFPL